MKDFWNARYSENGFAYGDQPNVFFEQELKKLKTGHLLLPAEGEGRNAVFASKLGWQVTAFDSSTSAKEKAMLLAKKQNTNFKYDVCAIENFSSAQHYDAIGLVFAHFPTQIRRATHQKIISLLKPGGSIILEGFAKEQLSLNSGGPKDKSMLFSIEELKKEFEALDLKMLSHENIILNEGKYHQGPASVIRMVATKLEKRPINQK